MMEDLHQEIPPKQSRHCNIPLEQRGGVKKSASVQMRREVGIRLRQIREALGYSQVQMAAVMRIHRQALGKIETGSTLPDALTLLPLCKKYGVTLEYIYYNNPRLLPQWLLDKLPAYQI